MKKPTKKALTNKLDKLCSKLVRARGRCERCGCEDYSKLQAAHIFSRTYRSVRWNIKLNIVCLCASCHFWGHKNPILFTEFVKTHLGELNYCELKNIATPVKKWTISEMQELYFNLNNDAWKF